MELSECLKYTACAAEFKMYLAFMTVFGIAVGYWLKD